MIVLLVLLACSETKPASSDDAEKPWLNDTDNSFNAPSSEPSGEPSSEPSTEDTSTPPPMTDMDSDGFEPPLDCDDTDDWVIPQIDLLPLPLFRCGMGQMLHAIESEQGWNATADYGEVTLSVGTGCIGQALQLDYSLDNSIGSDGVLVHKSFPAVDIGGKSFLLLSFLGDHDTETLDLTFSISDGSCTGEFTLPGGSALGAWRPAIVPIQRFSGDGCAPNLSNIGEYSVHISSQEGSPSGTLYLDDVMALNASDLSPDIRTRFCPPLDVSESKLMLANAILNSVEVSQTSKGHSIPEAWLGQESRSSYAAALSLIVLSLEYAHTGDTAFRQAAINIAEGFLELERHESGVWYEYYDSDLQPMYQGSVPKVRHVSWVIIALHHFITHAQPDDPTGYKLAMIGASDWLRVQQQNFSTEFPQWGGGISRDTEDNAAAYFAFVATAAQDPTNLAGSATIGLGQFLWGKIWDVNQLRMRNGVTDGGFSSPVGSWGTAFLIHHNHPREAIFNLAFSGGFLAVSNWDERFTGYALSEGPFQPSWEATGMMASLGAANAALYLQERLSIHTGGLLEGTPDAFLDPIQAEHGIQPTAWTYIGLYGDILSTL